MSLALSRTTLMSQRLTLSHFPPATPSPAPLNAAAASQLHTLPPLIAGLQHLTLSHFPHYPPPTLWQARELYELHIYTMGDKHYAAEIRRILDPTGRLFTSVISQVRCCTYTPYFLTHMTYV